jgi:hypothetical protein
MVVQKTVLACLPPVELIAVGAHLSIPVDHEAHEVLPRSGPLDLDSCDVVEVPEGLGDKILIPGSEANMAGDRFRPRERDVQVLVVEMLQIKGGRRGVSNWVNHL